MPTQRYQIIRDRLFARLRQASGKKVAYNHKVSTHIGDQPNALNAFLNVLNNLPGFQEDELFLTPGEVIPKPNVEELLAAIFDDYLSRNWKIEYSED